MKKVTYTVRGGAKVEVEYDENAPCVSCGLPVVSASMGGTRLCPWCDMGIYRDGEKWDMRDLMGQTRSGEERRGVAVMTPDRVGPDGTLLEIKSAAQQIKSASYGMLYGGQQSDKMLWTGVQRLLIAKGIDPGPVDGIPGPLTRKALSRLLDKERVTTPPSTSATSIDEATEVDGARFRLLERKS